MRESVQIKLIEQDEETYVLARSESRRDKEQGMRRRRLRKLIRRLREQQRQDLTRDELLLKLGAAKKEAGKAYGLLVIHTPTKDQPVTPQTFHFALDCKNSSSRSRALVGVHVLCLTFMRSGGMEKVARDWRKTCQEGKRT